MGGPGAGRVTRHELNAVPQSHVGHGERVLGEPPAPGCRCHPPERSSGSAVRHSSAQQQQQQQHQQQLPPSPPPLISLHLGTGNGTACAVVSGNNNPAITMNPSDSKAKKAAAMSSPPKHRRGFDPNDGISPAEFHRYNRRVKTKQRGFVCPTSCDLRRRTQTSPRSLDTSTSTRHYKTHTSLRCSMLDRLLTVPPPLQRDESMIT